MPRVLAISSQVARGHVGLSAIVPALQALGHEVIALPTMLLSNHPGHAHVAGERIPPEQLRRMADALDANGWLAGVEVVITGYMPSAAHVDVARSIIDRLNALSPGIAYHLDPVLGDTPKGLYVGRDAADAVRERLLPQCHFLKLNAFELGWLSGLPIASIADAVKAAKTLRRPSVVVTSVPGSAAKVTANVLVEAGEAWVCEVRRRPLSLNGAGDLFGALWLAFTGQPGERRHRLGRTVAALDRVLAGSAGRDELALIASLPGLADVAPLTADPVEMTGDASS